MGPGFKSQTSGGWVVWHHSYLTGRRLRFREVTQLAPGIQLICGPAHVEPPVPTSLPRTGFVTPSASGGCLGLSLCCTEEVSCHL